MRILTVFICLLMITACSKDEVEKSDPCGIENPIIWEGATMTFVKPDGGNPFQPENQDRITDNVLLTRDNNGGGLFNIATEPSEDKDTSPEGTLWALGSTDDLCDLSFGTFRASVGKPKELVGEPLVLFSVVDSIYIDIMITQWTQKTSGGGGFSYERSTE